MTKLIPPNGCLFCGLPKPSHGSRLDGLHPSGVWTWVEPSDRLRLQRMKRNRQIREAITMAKVNIPLSTLPAEEWVGQYVTYHGEKRKHILGFGQVFKVVEKRDNNGSVGFDTGEANLQWSAPWALMLAEAPIAEQAAEPMTLERAEEVFNPAAQTLDIVRAEIKRLTEKLEELKITEKVLSGL